MKQYKHLILGHLVLANGEIPKGYIAISDGKVQRIGDATAGIPQAEQTKDYGNHYILPSVIDAQVHSRSQLNNEDFLWSTSSAAAGGVGTIVDMPYDAIELICDADAFNRKKESSQQQARVDFALYATVRPDASIDVIKPLVDAGAVGFKFSTFGTDPIRFPKIEPIQMRNCMQEIAKYGLVVGVHNEDDKVVKSLIEKCKSEGYTDYTAHSASRPIYAENLAIHQIYELGAETGCHAHVVHCSNERGYQICSSFKQQGYKTTIEACLHYFILAQDTDLERLGGKGKVNPPIRTSDQQQALWNQLAAGNIDVVSTDHVSWSIDKKNHDNIFDNASGATGLSLILPLMVDGAIKRNIKLSRIVQALSYNPARLFNIQDTKGALEVGLDADFVVLKKEPYIYQAKDTNVNFCNWSPYEGKSIDFQVLDHYVRGQLVYSQGKVLAQPGYGKFVSPILFTQ